MSARIERPRFYEQQILAASDLDAQVDYARNALARHERYQHIWGVVTGLTIAQSATGLTVAPGVAVDGTGRQVVLTDERSVLNAEFVNALVFSTADDVQARYPVFIGGYDAEVLPSGFATGACAQTLSNREDEQVQIVFGAPGDELKSQTVPDVATGPQGAEGTVMWKVLLGFVQWDRTGAGKISNAIPQPRFAGAYGDLIAARGGSVMVRTSEAIQLNKPAMALSETDDARFQVGLLDTLGKIQPLMTLNEQGDLEVKGKLKGLLTGGKFITESGVASDGRIVALPAGVSESQVANGDAIVHVVVCPLDDSLGAPTAADLWSGTSLECRVDADRRVHCRKRWLKLDGAATPDVRDRAASCSFLIVANLKS